MKLLVCDDDISTIDVIQSQLNCRELGITSILRAYNGEAAKEIIKKEHPELILCDIGMPICNGIEVLKFIYDNNIYAEFAFLTCYEDFEYARKAVLYGATNYLTKPVDFDELNEALHRMIAAVKEHRRTVESMEDPSIVDARINNILRQIHDGFYGVNRKSINKILQKNNISSFTADSYYRLIYMAGDMTEAIKDGWEREMLAYSFSRLAEEAITDYVGSASTVVNVGEKYIYTTTYARADKVSENDCAQRARQFSRLCSLNLSITPVCLIGDEIPLFKTAECVTKLRSQMKKILLQAGSIYFLRDVQNIAEGGISIIDDIQILRLVKQQDKPAYIDLVASVLDKIVYSHKDNASMMAMLHQELLQVFYGCLRDNGLPVRTLFQSEQLRTLDQNAERSVSDMMNFASTIYDTTVTELTRASEDTDMIGAVKRYILEHYREDIDRNDVAAVAYITPNYLSKRFRSEMGMSLREYINQLRIEDAKRLLLSTNATISEVASEVGYDNISYFSTVFRKLCGMSPIEWCGGRRNEAKKNDD